MEIHQIIVSASPGDAVTNTALNFQDALRKIGPSSVFARYIDPRLNGRVFPLTVYEGRSHPDDLIIYHVSIGEPEVVNFLIGRRERLVLVYHNITPAHYFAELDPRFAGLLAGGRDELATLRDRAVLALAPSIYNARELEALGFTSIRVSPLPIDIESLQGLVPDADTVKELESLEGPVLLYVGQLLPHKRPDLLLQAYNILTTYLVPDAHLILLGPARLAPYHEALMTFTAEMNLHRACMPGWLSPEALAAHYRRADVFVTMSEHEGVCVPLLEAMSFGIPPVARAFGAIPETMAGAGLLLPAEEDPVLYAEAVAEVLDNKALYSEFVRRGRERLAGITVEAAHASFLDHVASVA